MGADPEILIRLIKTLADAGGALDMSSLAAACSIDIQALQDAVAADAGKNLVNFHGQISLRRKFETLDENLIYRTCVTRGRVEVVPCLASTNTVMLGRKDNLAHGDALLCEMQYQGRGRRETRWYGAPGAQITVSVCGILQDLSQCNGVALQIGTALAVAFDSMFGVNTGIKWPNDLYLGGKKLAGILVETVGVKTGVAAIAGVGINHKDADYPIYRQYTSLENEGVSVARNVLAAKVIDVLRSVLDNVAKKRPDEWISKFDDKDMLLGTDVAVECGGNTIRGRAQGVTADGELRLMTDRGPVLVTGGHVVS